jgi:hypothetical protein
MPPLAIHELGDAIARIPAPHMHLMTPVPSTADDDVLADILISMWALASGRFLRRGVRPEQLTREELINFWADDLTPTPGRHAAPPGLGQAETQPWPTPTRHYRHTSAAIRLRHRAQAR